MEYFGCLRVIDLVFSIILKLIQVWRVHFVGGEIMPSGRIFLIEYFTIILLKIKFLAIKTPHPRYWGVGLKVDLVFLGSTSTKDESETTESEKGCAGWLWDCF
jgi:hypothetical protein